MRDGKPVLLDLFCGAGGAARGYQQAGFYVVGVDIKPQPYYAGDEFHQDDAMTWPLDGPELIHASPPCQDYSIFHAIRRAYPYPDLLDPTRQRLLGAGLPWVIENVPGAPMRTDLLLCGSMFGSRVKRHRLFESNVDLGFAPFTCSCRRRKGYWLNAYTSGAARNSTDRQYCDAMGITWAPTSVAFECIPPAYTRYIGERLMAGEMVAGRLSR